MPFLADKRVPGEPPQEINLFRYKKSPEDLVEIRNACDRGEIWSLCNCRVHLVELRNGTVFFRHNSLSEKHSHSDRTSESEEHVYLKEAALRKAREMGYDAYPEEGEEEWRADALIVGKDGKRIAIEIQLSHHTAADIQNRTQVREKDGVETVWFFSDKIKVSSLTEYIRSRPFLELPARDAEKFVEDMVALYLRGNLVRHESRNGQRIPAQPIIFDVTCAECETVYSVIKAIVGYPNEAWGDEKGPVVQFLKFGYSALFDAARDFLSKRDPSFLPYKTHVPYLSGGTERYACPSCGEPGAPIKLNAALAARVPYDKRTALSLPFSYFGVDISRQTWGAKTPTPFVTERMSISEWYKEVSWLMRPNERKFAARKQKRAEKARADAERKRRLDREAAAASAAVKKRVWTTIKSRLAPALEKSEIEFDIRKWSAGRIPYKRKYSLYEKHIELNELIENRSPTLSEFEADLDKVIAMSEPGGPIADQFLGLPVEKWKLERMEEQELAALEERRARFYSFLLKKLPPAFLETELEKRDASKMNILQRACISEDAMSKVAGEVSATSENLKSASFRHGRLQDISTKILGYIPANSWMNSPHPNLHGHTPNNACDDLDWFDRAIRILLDKKSEK
ncbi:MAG: hypothetical protein JJ959_06930 [Nisaea sp.]|uniref:competence protein CoiA family protein n=1 Tax=Nisaea sp. TaxID=2024842 RepID=UPI001B0AA969|nr:hypothetical protein [Nisaea sp.]MBO6560253.1 hypothetical protein [Nisaea sp.]